MPIFAQTVSTLAPQQVAVNPFADSRVVQLETLAGDVVLPFETVEWVVLPGFTGFQLSPVEVVTEVTPGVDGGYLREVNVGLRELFLPLLVVSDESHTAHLRQLALLRRVVSHRQVADPSVSGGTHRVRVRSVMGERSIVVAYRGGFEGTDGGSDSGSRFARVGLTLVAVDPYWRGPEPITETYVLGGQGGFLGNGDNTRPWPRRLASRNVLGDDMAINVSGDVPTWPVIEIDGPCDSASITGSSGISVSVPGGVADGSTLVITTDPRGQSARLDGVASWSSVALTSTFAPLLPGVNLVDVTMSGATGDTRMRVTHTPAWESAW